MADAERTSSWAQAIQRHMEQARSNMDRDLREITESAQETVDWQSYVREHPWVCLGTAFMVGYWIVPRRREGVV